MTALDIPQKFKHFHLPEYGLKTLSTFGAGGVGSAVFMPMSMGDLTDVYLWSQSLGEDYRPLLIGHGSNTLLPDGIFNRPLICTKRLDKIDIEEKMLVAQCGAPLASMARASVKAGLKGLAFIIDIPGACGASVMGNAGAYNQAMADVLDQVELLSPQGERKMHAAGAFTPGYRSSGIEVDHLVLSARFLLHPEASDAIQKEMDQYQQHRRDAQPHIKGAAGSIFKNPPDKSAWQLIEDCGLKGYALGQAQVSPKHANWIINKGNASSTDIHAVIKHVQKTVAEKTGFFLEPEVKIIVNG